MKSVLIQGTLAFALLSQSVQGGVIIKSNFRQYSDVDSLAGHVEGSSSVIFCLTQERLTRNGNKNKYPNIFERKELCMSYTL